MSSYKYLGYDLHIGRDNRTCEISRRIELSWDAFGRLSCSHSSEEKILWAIYYASDKTCGAKNNVFGM